MKGLVLASHGNMALGILDTLKLFFSDLAQVEALALGAEDSPEDFLECLNCAVKNVDRGDGVVLAVDLLGGSPCHCGSRILAEGQIEVITGMNLPFLMEFLSARENSAPNIRQLLEIGREGMVYLNDRLAAVIDDDD